MEVSGRKDSRFKRKQLFCLSCKKDCENVSAEGYCETCNEFFCTTCLSVHRKQSATKNHVIKLKDEMPKGRVHTDQCSEICIVHKTEIVKYFCEDHDQVACGDCIIQHHKTCNVKLVSDASDEYDVIEELIEVKREIDNNITALRSGRHEIQCNIQTVTEMYSKAFEKIKHFRAELNKYLDRAEKDILDQIENLKSQDILIQTKLNDECMSMKKDMKMFRERLNENTDQMNNLFVAIKLAQKKLQESEELTKRIKAESRIKNYAFEPSKDLQDMKYSNSPFGTLQNETNSFIVARKSLDIQALGEVKCFVTGLAKMSANEILLADHKNLSLKILNVKKGKIILKKQMDTEPWDVTCLSEEKAVVTLPEHGKIVFLNIKDGLSGCSSINVKTNCQGIDNHEGLLAVSFAGPPAVQIMNENGHVLHEFRDTNIYCWYGHLVWNKANRCIYVSDYWQHSVSELKLNGDLHVSGTLQHRTWRRPRGLGVTRNGTVVVCCEGNDERVHKISPDTRDIMPLGLKNLKKPVAILVCEEQGKMCMYVSSHFSADDNNEIKVFDIDIADHR